MSKTEWTPNQKKAIEARGMQVLVSAAAGSGKTAVLTERAKNIIVDQGNPCSVSDVLVVTFTRAAANEIKDRIHDALKSCDLSNDHIRNQLTSLPLADICTIDSFCSKIVKDNFKKADVSADFVLLDEKANDELLDSTLDEVITRVYESDNEAFKKLSYMLISERDDSKLVDVIRDLYNYSRSYPSPERWLDSVLADFSEDKPINDTASADVIYKHLILFADCYIERFKKIVDLLNTSGGFSSLFFERFEVTAGNLSVLKSLAEKRDWDAAVNCIRDGIKYAPKATNSDVDEYVKTLANDTFKKFTDDLDNIIEMCLPTSEEHKKDCKILYPMIKALCDTVKLLSTTLEEKKKERNAYAFDDILHKCIDVLVVFNGDAWAPTDVAKALQGKYKEIFIDEYQDTNQAQNIIFEAISRDKNNLYFVGDVKQSIYKFRLASPQLFMELKKNLLPYCAGKIQPSQIILDKNFRSRKGILDVTNHIFKAIMSDAVGEVDYNENEELRLGADYFKEKNEPEVELLCYDCSDLKSAEAIAFEAEKIAVYVKKLLNRGITVTTKEGERGLEASDICILLRSLKNRSSVYVEALKKQGIPANTVSNEDVSLSKEVQLLISLIKVISNPLIDIPLISVMFSPVFGFTEDELAQIRMINRKSELFPCVEEYAKTSDKAKRFLSKLQLYRNIAASYPINEFVRFVVKDTDILNIYLAGTDGVSRNANIRGFVEFADSFTENGKVGLSTFVKSIDSAVKNEAMRAYSGFVSSDGVKIMSIHKSKGLEFPYVILADCSHDFNKQDAYKTLKLSRDTGIGLKIRKDEDFSAYNTISSVATEKDILYGAASEELRVLYVAMTRAKEHLTFACTTKTRDGLKKNVRIASHLDFDSEGKLHPYSVFKSGSASVWLLSCLAQNKYCEMIYDFCDIEKPFDPVYDYGIDTGYDSFHEEDEPEIDVDLCTTIFADNPTVNEGVLSSLEEKCSFRYGYDCSGILAMRTASSTERHSDERRYFANRKPEFAKGEFTGAQKGTAIHKFFEICNMQNASTDFQGELNALLSSGKLSEKEAEVLSENDVRCFFNASVGKRLLAYEEVLREYEFSFLKKASELYGDLPHNVRDEEIVVQGKLDCAFKESDGYVLIDYKSDNISDEDTFRAIYRPQLEIYSQALSQCTGEAVKEKYIYSFKLQKFIEL